MREGSIYCIINIVNGKKYVGQTIKDINFRLSTHVWDSKNPKRNKFALQKAIVKYGEENFIIGTIENTKEYLLNEREIYWISKLETFKKGYNETIGGNGMRGFSHSEETKKKISESQKGKFIPIETRSKISKALSGHVQSPESKNKKRISMIGKNKGSKNGSSKLTEKEVLFIRKSSLKGKELAKIYSISESSVSQIKNNKRWI